MSADRAEKPAGPVALGFRPGDVLVVSGGASGIGRATASLAASMAMTVVVWDLDGAALASTTAELAGQGTEVLPMEVDMADAAGVEAAMKKVNAELGPVRHLYNNAGPPASADLGFDDALVRAVGSVRSTTEIWSRQLPEGEIGSMVVTASVAGNLIGTEVDWYSAAKGALAGYVRHLAAHRVDAFRSNAVLPGIIATPRMGNYATTEAGSRIINRVPLRRMGDPDEVAAAALFLLSPLASYVNGALLVVDGGWTVTQ